MHKKSIFFVIGLVLLVVVFSTMSKGREQVGVSDASIPDAVPSTEVSLKNGDVYDLKAGYVMKTINGKKMKMLGYNGMIPGPIIHVREGDQVTVRFANNTDMPTLLHSHGIRMDNPFDGSQLVQKDMLPGESFDYVLKFPDPGAYWYHPHVRDDKQQAMGLYGAFIVQPKDANYWPTADHEETLILSDVLIEGGEVAPYSDKYVTHALMGRFGNTQMVNAETAWKGTAEPGEVHRLYVVNAASVRPFNFTVKGAKMKLVGGDAGRFEKETFVEGVVLAPSERAVIDVYFPTAGTFAVENKTPTVTYPLGQFTVSGMPVNVAGPTFDQLRTNNAESEMFAGLRHYLGAKPDKTIRLTLDVDMMKIMGQMGGGMSGGHMHDGGMGGMMNHAAAPIEWDDTMGDMNTYSTSDTTRWIIRDEETGKENMDVVWKFKKDSFVKIRIINDPASMHPMQHPIHFHGNRFLVLSTNGVPNDNMVWKDTTLLKTGDVVDVILETSNPGKWMAHCHILEHLHSGMMIEYDVE